MLGLLRHNHVAYATQQAMCYNVVKGHWTMRNRCEDKEVEGSKEQLERR